MIARHGLSWSSGAKQSIVGEQTLYVFLITKIQNHCVIFLLMYLAQFMGYIKVIEMKIPDNETEEGGTEKIVRYEEINWKLIAIIGRKDVTKFQLYCGMEPLHRVNVARSLTCWNFLPEFLTD